MCEGCLAPAWMTAAAEGNGMPHILARLPCMSLHALGSERLG